MARVLIYDMQKIIDSTPAALLSDAQDRYTIGSNADAAITADQVEFLAARVSQINECAY